MTNNIVCDDYSFTMSETKLSEHEKLLLEFIKKYTGNGKDKLFNQEELRLKMSSKRTGKHMVASQMSKIMKGKSLYFDYICQFLKITNKAIYLDGDTLIEYPKGHDIKKLLEDSGTLNKMLRLGAEHFHTRVPFPGAPTKKKSPKHKGNHKKHNIR